MSGSEPFIDDKRAREQLLESEVNYQAMAEAATDAIITINSESTILLVNPAAEKIFGYSIEEMLGQPLTMLMPEYLRHVHQAGIVRYLQTGQKHIEWAAVQLPGLHKSGAEILLEISFGEFIKGDQRFFTGILRDVTERKRAEETQISYARGDRAGQRCSAKGFHQKIETSAGYHTANYLAVLTQIHALSTTSRRLLAGNHSRTFAQSTGLFPARYISTLSLAKYGKSKLGFRKETA